VDRLPSGIVVANDEEAILDLVGSTVRAVAGGSGRAGGEAGSAKARW